MPEIWTTTLQRIPEYHLMSSKFTGLTPETMSVVSDHTAAHSGTGVNYLHFETIPLCKAPAGTGQF